MASRGLRSALLGALLCVFGGVCKASTTTPRMGLTTPAFGDQNWDVQLRNNNSIIDSSACIQSGTNNFTGTNNFNSLNISSGTPLLFYSVSGATSSYLVNTSATNKAKLLVNAPDGITLSSIAAANFTDGSIQTSAAASSNTFVQNTSVLQAGATFYVSSGTVKNLNVTSGLNLLNTATQNMNNGGLINFNSSNNAGVAVIQNASSNQNSLVITANQGVGINTQQVSGTDLSLNSILISSASPILSTSSLQSGSTFYVSSGTVSQLQVGALNLLPSGSLQFTNTGNTRTITFQSAAITNSYNLNLPTLQGPASTFLQNDGSGNLSWGTGNAVLTTSVIPGGATSYIQNGLTTQVSTFTTTGGRVYGIFTATGTTTLGGAGSSVTVSSNTILPGATFYQNGPITLGTPGFSTTVSSNTILPGATFYQNLGGIVLGAANNPVTIGISTTNSCGYVMGSLIQIKISTSVAATTSSGTTYTLTTTTATINMLCSTDRVKVTVNNGSIANTTPATNSSFASLFKNNADLSNAGNGFCGLNDGGTAIATLRVPCTMGYTDLPGTTNATDYEVKVKSSAAGDTIWNDDGALTFIEIDEYAQ